MIRRMLWGATLVAGFALGTSAFAATIPLTVVSGGIDSQNTRTCNLATCANSSVVWSLGSGELYAATGSVVIDTTLNTMTISLAVATSVLDASGAQAATDLGASSLVFTGGTYTATVPVTYNAINNSYNDHGWPGRVGELHAGPGGRSRRRRRALLCADPPHRGLHPRARTTREPAASPSARRAPPTSG